MSLVNIPQPSMAVNSKDVPGPFRFANTMEVNSAMAVAHMLGCAAGIGKGAPGGSMHALVINCHGIPGVVKTANDTFVCNYGWGLKIGKDDIVMDTIPLFRTLRGCFKVIYFASCGAAAVTVPGGSPKGSKLEGRGDGTMLCAGIAKAAGCMVIASTESQTVPKEYVGGYPGSLIDMQGVWLKWDKEGNPAGREVYNRAPAEAVRQMFKDPVPGCKDYPPDRQGELTFPLRGDVMR